MPRYFDRTTGRFRKRPTRRQEHSDRRQAGGPLPLDMGMLGCRCGKLGFASRADAELVLDLTRTHVLYECRDGMWHASRDVRPR